MSSLLLGVTAACAASTMYNLGIALQAIEASASPPEHGMRLSLVAGLLRRPLWLAGTLLAILGWPLQTAALLLAPLTVVQPALAFGLVLLLVIAARDRHQRIGRREFAAVAAIIAGVGALAALVPTTETAHAAPGATVAVLALIALVAVGPFLAARRGAIDGRVAALGAGAGFAWSGLSTKYVADALGGHLWLAALAWAGATGLASGLALIGEMTALQSRGAARVAPVVFVVQVALPVLAAPLLVGENWTGSPARSAGVCAALVVVIGGALALMSSPTVTAFVKPSQPPATSRRTNAR